MENNEEIFENGEDFMELTEEEMKEIEGGEHVIRWQVKTKSGGYLNVRQEPTTNSKIKFQIPNLHYVDVISSERDSNGILWYYIKYRGNKGYVSASRIKKVSYGK